ncbi:MAG: hypothetical protein EPO21_08460 [Chloroflexota bacterium]|nr:MAG: hypothetical protein EPO21_08460 [Chloroflexota bacterium]
MISAGLLVGLLALAFGIHAGDIGYFVDDSLFAQLYHFGGAGALVEAMTTARVLTAIPYLLRFELLGLGAFGQQLANMLVHSASAGLFLVLLTTLLPRHNHFCLLVTALFVVYPVVATHLWGAFIGASASMPILLLSMAAMVFALKNGQARGRITWLLLGLSLTLALAAHLMYELYFGLELARPLLILKLSRRHFSRLRAQMRWTLRQSLPFMGVWILFLAWRLRLGPLVLGDYKVSEWAKPSGGDLVSKLLRGYVELLPNAWRFRLEELVTRNEEWTPWLVGVAAGGLVVTAGLLVLLRSTSHAPDGTRLAALPGEENDRLRITSEYALICGFGLLVTGLGFMVLLPTTYGFDRYFSIQSRVLYGATLGASLATAAGISACAHLVTKRPWIVVLSVVAVMIGLASARHYLNQLEAVRATEIQRAVLWQLVWRAPALRTDTYLIVSIDPDRIGEWKVLNTHFEIVGDLALVYEQDRTGDVFGSEFLSPDAIERLGATGLAHVDRAKTDPVSFDRLLVIRYEQGCLKVLSPRMPLPDPAEGPLRRIAVYSNPDNIVPEPEGKVYPARAAVLGKEPTHGWCYYYEKASWAAQREEWDEVVRLYDGARALGLEPVDPVEWLPLVLAHDMRGSYAEAGEVASGITEAAPNIRETVARHLERLSNESDRGGNARLAVELNVQAALVRP